MTTVHLVYEFPEVFSELLERSGVTCYQIAQFAGLDQGYLSRLKSGEKRNPSVEVLLGVSFALVHFSDKIRLYDIECLFKSAGRHIPIKH